MTQVNDHYTLTQVKDLYQAEVNLSEKVTVDSACYYRRVTNNESGSSLSGYTFLLLLQARGKQ